jgi:hypothetical protein
VLLGLRTIADVPVKPDVQVPGHEMPEGLLVTAPVPAIPTVMVVVAAERPDALPALIARAASTSIATRACLIG